MSNGKIIVLGGSGFIGSHICELAVQTRHDVISISRSGKPPSSAHWTQAVDWVRGDAAAPDSWRDYLQGADAVIHSVGVLVENPLSRNTYQRATGDSARSTARAAREAGVGAFVYMSVVDVPLLPQGFRAAKHAGEAAAQAESHRWAVLRPGLVYGSPRLWSLLPGRALRYASNLPVLEIGLGALRPLPVETVASAALRAAMEPNQGGILDIEAIEHLGRSHLRDWMPRASAA